MENLWHTVGIQWVVAIVVISAISQKEQRPRCLRVKLYGSSWEGAVLPQARLPTGKVPKCNMH